jgi:hypothetical protein
MNCFIVEWFWLFNPVDLIYMLRLFSDLLNKCSTGQITTSIVQWCLSTRAGHTIFWSFAEYKHIVLLIGHQWNRSSYLDCNFRWTFPDILFLTFCAIHCLWSSRLRVWFYVYSIHSTVVSILSYCRHFLKLRISISTTD